MINVLEASRRRLGFLLCGYVLMPDHWTCELNGANPFDYLTELQKHADETAKNPAAWMPWNYRQILPQAGTSQNPA